nr:MFS transporter [uncultured Desulfobulbus sp.]
MRYGRLKRTFLILAFFALSLNLRAPITSLPPVIGELQNTLRISAGVAGLLTSIPVLCFGFLTPLLGFLMKRISLETSGRIMLAGIIVGSLVRSGGSISATLAGTVIIGVALTVGNIAGLMVLGRDFKEHASTMTGVYVCGMSIGATVTTAMTAPFVQLFGYQVSMALVPVGLALSAALLWGMVSFYHAKEAQLLCEFGKAGGNTAVATPAAAQELEATSRSVLKMAIVWLLSAAFAAHTFIFYGLTAWLPLYLKDTISLSASTAGVVASLFQVLGILGCMGIPALAATRKFSQTTLFLVVPLSWFAVAAGFLLRPTWWPLWIMFGGIGSGGGFTVIFSLVMQYARTLDENRILSTVIQAAGYAVASISPFVIGHLYSVTGGWSVSFLMLALAAVLMALCGVVASRQQRRS